MIRRKITTERQKKRDAQDLDALLLSRRGVGPSTYLCSGVVVSSVRICVCVAISLIVTYT